MLYEVITDNTALQICDQEAMMQALNNRFGELFFFSEVDDGDAQIVDQFDQLLVHFLAFDHRRQDIGNRLKQLSGPGRWLVFLIYTEGENANGLPTF